MFKRAYMNVSFFVLVALFGCTTSSDTEPDPQAPVSATVVDLKEFRDYARTQLETVFGEIEFAEEAIYFQDGCSVDIEPFSDYSRLFYLTRPAARMNLPDINGIDSYLTFYISLQGYDSLEACVIFAEYCDIDTCPPPQIYASAMGGIAVLVSTASQEEVQELIDTIKNLFPDATLHYIEEFKTLFFDYCQSMNGKELLLLFEYLEQEPLVAELDLDGETFIVPYEFAAAVALGSGHTSQKVELLDHISVTREYRKDYFFTTAPSLPEPFGPGSIPSDFGLGYVVHVKEGENFQTCIASMEMLEEAIFEDADEFSRTVIAYNAEYHISTIAMMDCVDFVKRNQGDPD